MCRSRERETGNAIRENCSNSCLSYAPDQPLSPTTGNGPSPRNGSPSLLHLFVHYPFHLCDLVDGILRAGNSRGRVGGCRLIEEGTTDDECLA